jgi:glycosyltransferase involved in cell wall biosynthesis
MARTLVDLGLSVEVLTVDHEPGELGWRRDREPDGVTVTRIRPPTLETQALWMGRVMAAVGPADAVIVFSLGDFVQVAVSMAALWDVPAILFGRGRDAMFDLFDWQKAPFLLDALRRCSRVVAVTQEMARLLQPFHPGSEVASWPNAVDQGHFYPRTDKASLRRRCGLPESGLLVGFSGQLRPSKGIDELLGALVRLRQRRSDVGLVIIGGVAGLAEPAVEAWRQRHPQHVPALHVLPFIEPVQLPEVLSCLDQAWFPVIFDGFSNSLLETVACGVPVIATPIGGNPEVIRHGETGLLVPVGDAGALAAASWHLATQPDMAAAMAAQALAELPATHHPRFERERLRALMADFGLQAPA